VRETDLAAGGAAAADNPGSRFCRGCGVLFLHPIHLRSEAHRARMGRLQAVRDPPPQPRGDAAAVVVGRMAWDEQRRPHRDKRPTSAACWTTSWAAWT
ncbi:unnamed protein product, partial [Ixodes persulcatus]